MRKKKKFQPSEKQKPVTVSREPSQKASQRCSERRVSTRFARAVGRNLGYATQSRTTTAIVKSVSTRSDEKLSNSPWKASTRSKPTAGIEIANRIAIRISRSEERRVGK